MFRYISELKGLIIDVDSFRDLDVKEWSRISKKHKCLFLISDEVMMEKYIHTYGKEAVYAMKKHMKLFAPSPNSHQEALVRLQLNASEVAYVSKNRSFLDYAMSFLGGTIWINETVSYEDASKAPDVICNSFQSFNNFLLNPVSGFIGEVYIFPNEARSGIILPIKFDGNEGKVLMHIMGRYFGGSHYMNQLHPYSTAIYRNKGEGKAKDTFNEKFTNLYIAAINLIQKECKIDGVLSVPTRPGKKNRFAPILNKVCESCNVEDYSDAFKCILDYPLQKTLNAEERKSNVLGAFEYQGDLTGKRIVLIDDIVTTGATLKECVSALKQKGVEEIQIVVLAVNQWPAAYWSSDMAQVKCFSCGEKMNLLVNSKSGDFFYSCPNCLNSDNPIARRKASKSFVQGRSELIARINEEMKKISEENER